MVLFIQPLFILNPFLVMWNIKGDKKINKKNSAILLLLDKKLKLEMLPKKKKKKKEHG